MRLVIALQFYSEDRDKAMRLARFAADIEPAFRADVELCFVARFDAQHDEETMAYVAKKMAVSKFTTTTQWTCWPAGCNAMALDFLREAMRRYNPDLTKHQRQLSSLTGKSRDALFKKLQENLRGEWSDVSFILMMEPDCVPMDKNWINRLKDAWNDARRSDCLIMGAWWDGGGPGHINGNCVIVPWLASEIDLRVITPYAGWDVAIAPQVFRRWATTDLIRNHFGGTNAVQFSGEPALIHGYKNDSAYDIARKLLL
jgi:hypothetical protein